MYVFNTSRLIISDKKSQAENSTHYSGYKSEGLDRVNTVGNEKEDLRETSCFSILNKEKVSKTAHKSALASWPQIWLDKCLVHADLTK